MELRSWINESISNSVEAQEQCKQEIVGEAFDRDEALAAKDHYNEHEDNTNIYYVVQSVTIPTAVKRKVKK